MISPELAELQVACLTRRRSELRTLVQALETADDAMIERAVRMATSLSPVADCDDVDALRGAADRAPDPQLADARAGLVDELVAVRLLVDTAKTADAIPRALALVERAREIGPRALEAEALLYVGFAQEDAGRYAEAEQTLRAALVVAQAGRADALVARAASALALDVGRVQGRPDEGRTWGELSLATARRLGDPARETGRAHFALAVIELGAQRLEAAEAHVRSALEITSPDEPLVLGERLNTLGGIVLARGRPREARELYQRARDHSLMLGDTHPAALIYDLNLAGAALALGDTAAAVVTLVRVVEERERAFGPDHPRVLGALAGLAAARAQAGQLDDAIAAARRVLDGGARAGGPPPVRAARPHPARRAAARPRRSDEAARLLAATPDELAAAGPDDALDVGRLGAELAAARGDRAGAAAALTAAIAAAPAETIAVAAALRALARIERERGRPGEARDAAPARSRCTPRAPARTPSSTRSPRSSWGSPSWRSPSRRSPRRRSTTPPAPPPGSIAPRACSTARRAGRRRSSPRARPSPAGLHPDRPRHLRGNTSARAPRQIADLRVAWPLHVRAS